MGSITAFSFRSSRLVILFSILVAVIGIYTYIFYPANEDPTIRIREARVTASFPGMSPGRIENLVTRPIEEEIRQIANVKTIRSDSKTGLSVIRLEIEDEVTDLKPIWQELRNKMADLKPRLPDGTIGPFVDDEVGLTAVATVALWGEGYSLRELRDNARDIRDGLYVLQGIRKVELFGLQEERIFLEISNARLAELGLSPLVIFETLQQQNIILPGGEIDAAGQSVIVEPSGNFTSVEDIGEVLFPLPGTDKVLSLRDIATVRRTFEDPPEKPVYFNNHQSIVLSVSIIEGTNSLEFGQRLSEHLAAVQERLPIGLVLEYATYQPDLVRLAVDGAVRNIYQTLAVVLFVVMIFLGLRTGLIVGSIVPMAMLLALIFMRAFDIELHRVSIAAMIIALGLLVDNGIVVAEDIRRRLEEGTERKRAALESGQSLALPLLTSSLTTMLAFMPLMLAVGGAGEYTRALAQVIMIILLGSWFLAMFVTPSFCVWFIKRTEDDRAARFERRPYQVYRRMLGACLARPRWFMSAMVAALALSTVVFQDLVTEFFPTSDRNQFLVYIDLPAGSSVRETQKVVTRFGRWLGEKAVNPEVTGNIAYVGDGGPRFYLSLGPIDPDPHKGFVTVNVETTGDVDPLMARSRRFFLDQVPEARARIKTMWMGETENGIIQVRLQGPDADELYEKGRIVEKIFAGVPGIINLRNDWENKILKIRVLVDQVRARRANVTSQEIANSLVSYLDGAEITDYREGDTLIPIVIRGTDAERENLRGLQSVTVYSQASAENVPLPQIATFEAVYQYGRLKRRNQVRTLTVEAKHIHLKASQLAEIIRPQLKGLEMKPGHGWSWGGEIEDSGEAEANLFAHMPLAVLLIVTLLIWQFNSFRRPAIILMTIPLSFVGAVIGLWLTGAAFGFMAILGLFSLAGIIINNGIVLIDRIDLERQRNKPVHDAVVDAAMARLRPIIMTTMTTSLGLVPLTVFGGPLWFAMGVVISFGLAIGTLFTLGFVPVAYSLLFRREDGKVAAAAA